MKSATECRSAAAECLKLAAELKHAENRKIMLDAARLWTKRAEEAEMREQSAGPHARR